MTDKKEKIENKPPDLPASFEEAFRRLSEVVDELEGGERSLTEMTDLFEEGVRLSKFCSSHLDSVETKVERLLGEDPDTTAPFDEGESSSP